MSDNEIIYSDSLPSIHFTNTTILEFEEILINNCSSPSISITVEENGFKHNFESFEQVLQDSQLPDFLLEYYIDVKCEEGKIKVIGDANGPTMHSIRISGSSEWVKSKVSDIDSYLDRRKNRIRSYGEALGIGVLFSAGVAGGGGLVLTNHWDYVWIPAAIIWSFCMFLIMYPNRAYPYVLIKRKGDEPYHPYLWKVIAATVSTVTILGFVLEISS